MRKVSSRASALGTAKGACLGAKKDSSSGKSSATTSARSVSGGTSSSTSRAGTYDQAHAAVAANHKSSFSTWRTSSRLSSKCRCITILRCSTTTKLLSLTMTMTNPTQVCSGYSSGSAQGTSSRVPAWECRGTHNSPSQRLPSRPRVAPSPTDPPNPQNHTIPAWVDS